MSENRLRAVIYARFSSHNQDEISIADQVSVGTRFIEDMRADLVGIYADEAKTGTNDKRDDFRRLMSDAKKDVYDIVVVWNTNRLNRDMLNAFVMIAELFKWGKDFRSVTQSDLNDPNNPMRLIMYAIHAWHDEEYSNALSTDVKRGQGEKAKQGHPLGQLRYGWDIAGAHIDASGKYHPGDHYEVNEHEAGAVRSMYRLRARGYSWTAIAAKLNALGYRNKYGRPITDVMVAEIVRNEAYKGVYSFGRERIEGGMPRIVTDAEWEAAQDSRRRRRRVKHRRHVYVKPGMRFGELEVKEAAPSRKHHTRWLCECNACGGSKVEWATRLTSGRAADCGCTSSDGRERDELGRFV